MTMNVKNAKNKKKVKKENKFPYQRSFYTDKEILEVFNSLKQYDYTKYVMDNKWYIIKNFKYPYYKCTYLGYPTVIISGKKENEEYELSISDMFQEHCRIQCKKWFSQKTPLEIWQTEQQKILSALGESSKTPKNMREALWKVAKECEPFKPRNLMAMIQMFGAKSVLDFSSGWGDRLVGAIASNVYYCGVDPNECLVNGYKEIQKFLGANKKNVKMIKSGIESAKLSKRKFDLVMTSPPYYDLEKYSNGVEQSISLWNTEKTWFDEFLCVAIKKCWLQLNNIGHLVLNINQKKKEENYLQWLLDFMYTVVKDSHFLGIISYANSPELKNPQPMFIWEKNAEIPINLYNPPFYIKPYMFGEKNVQKFYLIDDGKLVTGSKQRAIVPFMLHCSQKENIKEFVYAGPVQGVGAISLAYGAELTRLHATIIVEKVRPMHPHVIYAKSFRGTRVIEINVPEKYKKSGYIDFLERYAKKYIGEKKGVKKIEFGLNDKIYTELFTSSLLSAYSRTNGAPEASDIKRMWVVAGSATLLNVLYKVFPNTFFCVVQVGRTIWPDQIDQKRTKLYKSDQLFHEIARELPPYNTVKTYDAKLWKFFVKDGQDGDFIYNVASTKIR